MLRGTVREVHALGDVSVTVDAVYGEKSLIRMKSRVNAAPGDRVFVDDVSPSGRAHDWVVIGGLTEIGGQATPAPHEHPIGQVVGLKDWLTQYETWMGDHTARLDAADQRIAEGKVAVDQARKDLTQAQTDIADAVRRVAIQRTDLDAAVVRLDQTDRNVAAAGTRISANETALGAAQKRIESAETTLQVASTDLGALKTTVGDVAAKAAASDQKATDALTKAGAAQVSADGKTTITRATSPASQPGTAVGDTHFTMSSMGGGGVVTRQQRWDGSTWQDETVGHQVLASLDLGKATVGELDGGRVAARSLTSDRLVVGVSGNLIVDPNFNDATVSGWRVGGRWLWDDSGAEKRFVAVSDGTITTMTLNGGQAKTPSLPVTAGTTYALTLDLTGAAQVFLTIQYANGVVETPGVSIQTIPYTADRRPVSLVVRPDDYVVKAANGSSPVGILVNVRQPANAPVGTETSVYSAKFAPRTGTVLIENGAVTGEKIEGVTVAAKVVTSMTAEHRKLVVTEDALLAQATVLGTLTADQINSRRLIRGRDAILTGTVDVGQLNVTGAMSAKIISTATLQARQGFFTDGLTAQDATLLGTTVAEKLVVTDAFSARVVNAMTAQTKNLVVTGDAILNQATVVQSLVTPELIADKANVATLGARLVAAGAIVSKDSTGSVQITPAGLVLQDTAPGATSFTRQVKLTSSGLQGGTRTTQTVNIDGVNNWMTGTFRTGENGPRISMLSGPTSGVIDLWGSATDGHGSAWYDTAPSSVLDHSLTLMGISDYSTNANNPAIRLFPYRGTFAFQGRWAQNTDPMKFVVVTNRSGLSAGQYNTFTIPYRTNFPTNNALRFPFVSVESENGADMMVTIVTQTQSAITINVINKSGSKASGALIVKIVTFNVGSY